MRTASASSSAEPRQHHLDQIAHRTIERPARQLGLDPLRMWQDDLAAQANAHCVQKALAAGNSTPAASL